MNVDLGAKDVSLTSVPAQQQRTDSLVALAMKKTTASTERATRDTKRVRAKSEPLIEASLTGTQFDVRFTVRRSDAMQCAQWLSERAVVARRKRSAATSVRINKATAKGGAQ